AQRYRGEALHQPTHGRSLQSADDGEAAMPLARRDRAGWHRSGGAALGITRGARDWLVRAWPVPLCRDRKDAEKRTHGVDLVTPYLERLECDERVAGAVRVRVAKVHPQHHDAVLFIDDRDARFHVRVLH